MVSGMVLLRDARPVWPGGAGFAKGLKVFPGGQGQQETFQKSKK